MCISRIFRSFNSQRDGILREVAKPADDRKGFNSQRDGILRFWWCFRGYACEVSIPNGMEFYLNLALFLPFVVGFNSQRDGILRKPKSKRYRELQRFNSQRDGILQTPKWIQRRQMGVSIPNGMEFYAFINCLWTDSGVSIPNGMEFYSIPITALCRIHSFQFPTGWNSTKGRRRLWWNRYRFNSQRDGILRLFCLADI